MTTNTTPSRLDRMIERLNMQRDLLNRLCFALNNHSSQHPGIVVELGLGNGRTYDHLRARLTDRRIIAFDRVLNAHPQSVPPEGDLILGDIRETVPAFVRTSEDRAALVHADLGKGIVENDRVIEGWLPGVVLALTHPGALIVTSTAAEHEQLEAMPLGIDQRVFKYFLYRRR